MKRLYVLLRNDLPLSYMAVQGGHAVAEWVYNNKGWNNQTLVYLQVNGLDALKLWKYKLEMKGIGFT